MSTNARDIERQLIGKLLLQPSLLFEHQEAFNGCPFEPIHQLIFEEIATAAVKGNVSIITIAKTIAGHFAGKQGEAMKYLTGCKTSVNLNDSTEEQLLFVIEQKTNNEAQKVMAQLHAMAVGGASIPEIESVATEFFAGAKAKEKASFTPFLDNLAALTRVVEDNSNPKAKPSILTGLHGYDNFAGGMHLTDLEIIGGKTSMGKTAFVLCRLRHVAQSGIPCVVFNYEMSNTQLTARIISKPVGISSKRILTQPFAAHEFELYHAGISKVQDLPIYIADTTNSSLQHAVKQLRYLVQRLGIKYAVFDFLQRMKINGHRSNREQEVGTIAQELKNEAKALNIKIDALSQLSRNKATEGKEPVIGDLRDSGQVEEAADIVTLIHRPEYYLKQDTPDDEVGKAKIIIAKGRNIGVTDFMVGFDAEFTEFYNLDSYTEKVKQMKPNYDF